MTILMMVEKNSGSLDIGFVYLYFSLTKSLILVPMKIISFFLLTGFCLLCQSGIYSQVGINPSGAEPNSTAGLDVSFSDKGILIPRLTQAQIQAIINPANGLLVFCTTDKKFYAYIESLETWRQLAYGTGSIIPDCGVSITDSRDGKSYETVFISGQCWMAENLNIGTRIDVSVTPTDNGDIEKYCYDNSETNCDTYGGLYAWNEMMQYVTTAGIQGICPTGWHIPTDAEWDTLEVHLGGDTIAGGKMKDASPFYWQSPNTGATNSSGFTALPAGKLQNSFFTYMTVEAGFWSSSVNTGSTAFNRVLSCNYDDIFRFSTNRLYSFSVRCLKD